MTLLDQAGAEVVLGEELASGGEGRILEVSGRPHEVAKLYLTPPGPELVEKLESMVQAFEPGLRRFAAWPSGLLRSKADGTVAGFVMPRVTVHKPLHLLYSTSSRDEHFPCADWGFLLRTAVNVAGAFEALHARGHLVGDVNETNLLASPRSGSVVFVDCDSFQVRGPAQTFPCRVAVPHFVPPELQAAGFHGQVRTPKQESFSLGVLLFQLLFLGRHPFAGRWSGPGEMTTEQAIAERRFAFGPGAAGRGMEPPPLTPPLELVGPVVSALFERAFLGEPGARPPASRFRQALSGLAGQLVTCPVDPAHLHPGHLAACPWCKQERHGGLFFAARPERFAVDGLSLEAQQLLRRFRQVVPPELEPPRSGPRADAPVETGALEAELRGARRSWVGALAAAALLPPSYPPLLRWLLGLVFGSPGQSLAPWLAAAALVTCGGTTLVLGLRALRLQLACRARLARLRAEATQAVRSAASARARLAATQALVGRRLTRRKLAFYILERRITEHSELYRRGLEEARVHAGGRQVLARLEQVSLATAGPPGLGTACKAELRWLGVRTARDVVERFPSGTQALELTIGAPQAAALEHWAMELRMASQHAVCAAPDRRTLAALLGRVLPNSGPLLEQLRTLVTDHKADCDATRLALEALTVEVLEAEAHREATSEALQAHERVGAASWRLLPT